MLGYSAVFFRIKIKTIMGFITLLLYFFSDIIWKSADTFIYQEAFRIHGINIIPDSWRDVAFKIMVIFLGLISSYWVRIFTDKVFKTKIFKNIFISLEVIFLQILVFYFYEKLHITRAEGIIFVLIHGIVLMRSIQGKIERTFFNFREFLSNNLPVFFDNGYFLRSDTHSGAEGTWMGSPELTSKMTYFIFLYTFGKIINYYVYGVDVFLDLPINPSLLPVLDSVPPSFYINAQYPQWKIFLSTFFWGLIFIIKYMSISLVVESSYIIFGYNLKSTFDYKFNSKSFSSYFTSTMPMHSDFIKESFIFPAIEFAMPFFKKRILFYFIIFLSVIFGGMCFNLIKFSFLFTRFGLWELVIKTLLNDLIYFSVLAGLVLLIRPPRKQGWFFSAGLNILFIYLHGVLLLIKVNYFVIPSYEKWKLILYLIGIRAG